MHNKTTAKQTSHSAKRKRSDFENFRKIISIASHDLLYFRRENLPQALEM